MPSNIMVIFDHSGSMGHTFSSTAADSAIRGRTAIHTTKIEEAKAQLISWLKSSNHEQITIIPFSSVAERPRMFRMPDELNKIEVFLLEITADGQTNLALALEEAISLAVQKSSNWYVRILLLTDGLSDTNERDLELVNSLPERLGIDAIFIDPNERAERHMRQLCKGGHFLPVFGPAQLAAAMSDRGSQYAKRREIFNRSVALSDDSIDLLRRVDVALSSQIPPDSKAMIARPEISKKLATIMKKAGEIKRKIEAQADNDSNTIAVDISQLEQELVDAAREAEEFISDHMVARDELSSLDASLFSPNIVSRRDDFLIQCWIHLSEDSRIVARLATETDPQTYRQSTTPLNATAKIGDVIHAAMDGNGLKIREPIQKIVLSRRPTPLYFVARAPRIGFRRTFRLFMRLHCAGAPIGHCVCTVRVGKISQEGLKNDDASKLIRYKQAFLSYAAEDRKKVLEVAQTLIRLDIEIFQDVLNLTPGERWEKRLFTTIDSCDLFMLFWSKAAANSMWVEKETLYALQRQEGPIGHRLDIIPYLLEGPPPPKPPRSLRHLHFNDPIRSIIAAYVDP